RTDADAREARLGDGRVDHALLAELREQALAHLVRAVVVADLFAHEEDVRIATHLLEQRLTERLAVANLSHQYFSTVTVDIMTSSLARGASEAFFNAASIASSTESSMASSTSSPAPASRSLSCAMRSGSFFLRSSSSSFVRYLPGSLMEWP